MLRFLLALAIILGFAMIGHAEDSFVVTETEQVEPVKTVFPVPNAVKAEAYCPDCQRAGYGPDGRRLNTSGCPCPMCQCPNGDCGSSACPTANAHYGSGRGRPRVLGWFRNRPRLFGRFRGGGCMSCR